MLSKRSRRPLGMAKSLRKRQTSTEFILWKKLRNRAFHRYKFRRQYALGKWIVDFICIEYKLIIEIDGGDSHRMRKKNDEKRDYFIERDGYKIVRFSSTQVRENMDWVLEKIHMELTNSFDNQ